MKLRHRSQIRNKVIKYLPSWLKARLYREMINFDPAGLEGLTCSIATSKDDLSAAFRLLHDNYVQSGFMNPHPSGMRLTKYHALPSTTTIVAKIGDDVVGTVSLVRNGLFGSPVESIFDLTEYKKSGSRICEVSSLAVNKKYSGQRGKVLFPLLNYLYHYSVRCFGVDYLAIAVNPAWWDFYEYILMFKQLQHETVSNYSFVNGAPAVGGILDLRTVRDRYSKVYGHKELNQNLYHLLAVMDLPGSTYPPRKTGTVSDPVMTPELLNYFFREQSDVLESLNDRERTVLRDMYRHPKFQLVLPYPSDNKSSLLPRGGGTRHDVEIVGHATSDKGISVRGVFKNVSYGGMLFIADRGLRIGEVVTCQLRINDSEELQVQSKITWSSPSGQSGLHIINLNREWQLFVQNLENCLLHPLEHQHNTKRTAS